MTKTRSPSQKLKKFVNRKTSWLRRDSSRRWWVFLTSQNPWVPLVRQFVLVFFLRRAWRLGPRTRRPSSRKCKRRRQFCPQSRRSGGADHRGPSSSGTIWCMGLIKWEQKEADWEETWFGSAGSTFTVYYYYWKPFYTLRIIGKYIIQEAMENFVFPDEIITK